MKTLPLWLAVITLFGCASGQIYSPSATFSPTNAREINDEDIRKAYMAKPQMIRPAAVAFYSLTSGEKEFEKGLATLPNIKSFYKIPSLLVEGIPAEHRYSRFERREAVSLKKLRLLGARAHADLLLVYSARARVSGSVNPWAITFILLVTPLFMPAYDVKVTVTIDAWLMDIRNGYLYKEISLTESASESTLTLYGQAKAEDRLLKAVKAKLHPLIYKEITAAMATGVATPPTECPSCPACSSGNPRAKAAATPGARK